MTDFAPNRLAKNLYGVWRLHVLEQHGHPAPWNEMDEAHKQTWVSVAEVAYRELLCPDPFDPYTAIKKRLQHHFTSPALVSRCSTPTRRVRATVRQLSRWAT